MTFNWSGGYNAVKDDLSATILSKCQESQLWIQTISQSNIFIDIFSMIGWAIILLFKSLVDVMYNLWEKIYSLLDFTQAEPVKNFIEYLYPLLWILVATAIIVLGYSLITRDPQKEKPKVLQTISIFILIIVGLPTMMNFANKIVIQTNDYIMSYGTYDGSLSDSIIANGIIDFEYISQNVAGIDDANSKYRIENGVIIPNDTAKVNGFAENPNAINYINPTEKITYTNAEEAQKDQNTDIYGNNDFSPVLFAENGADANGNFQPAIIEENKFFGLDFSSYNYRYKINYFIIIVSLICVGISLFFISFKAGRIIFELVFHQIFAILLSATDFTSGQRAKQVLKSILSSYVVLMITSLMLKLYLLGYNWLISNPTFSNPFLQSFILLIFSLTVIDGPNIIERIIGIDAGLQSGLRTMAALFMGAKAISSTAKAGAGLLKNVGHTAGRGGARAFGYFDGMKESHRSQTNDRNSLNPNNLDKTSGIEISQPGENRPTTQSQTPTQNETERNGQILTEGPSQTGSISSDPKPKTDIQPEINESVQDLQNGEPLALISDLSSQGGESGRLNIEDLGNSEQGTSKTSLSSADVLNNELSHLQKENPPSENESLKSGESQEIPRPQLTEFPADGQKKSDINIPHENKEMPAPEMQKKTVSQIPDPIQSKNRKSLETEADYKKWKTEKNPKNNPYSRYNQDNGTLRSSYLRGREAAVYQQEKKTAKQIHKLTKKAHSDKTVQKKDENNGKE